VPLLRANANVGGGEPRSSSLHAPVITLEPSPLPAPPEPDDYDEMLARSTSVLLSELSEDDHSQQHATLVSPSADYATLVFPSLPLPLVNQHAQNGLSDDDFEVPSSPLPDIAAATASTSPRRGASADVVEPRKQSDGAVSLSPRRGFSANPSLDESAFDATLRSKYASRAPVAVPPLALLEITPLDERTLSAHGSTSTADDDVIYEELEQTPPPLPPVIPSGDDSSSSALARLFPDRLPIHLSVFGDEQFQLRCVALTICVDRVMARAQSCG
jgi:hypothetical protein